MELQQHRPRRLLLALRDGRTVETVLLPRQGVCVSTQIGCAVGCRFCMTGRDGLLRQLGSAEIVAQVALARTLRPVKKVVFMGMGEPSHNLDAVMQAIDLLGTLHAAVGDLNRVKRIVKLMSLVNSTADFTEQHSVTNGASALIGQIFGERGADRKSVV